jgi:hypothetical protein
MKCRSRRLDAASEDRLDPGVSLLDKPFLERELLDKGDAVLAPHTTALTRLNSRRRYRAVAPERGPILLKAK